jgi:hypothetical protein
MKQNVSLSLSGVDLSSLVRFLESPIELAGQLSGDTSTVIDPSYLEQPEGDFEFKVAKAKLLPSNIPTTIGPFPVPGFDFQSLDVAGNMKTGVVKIEKLIFGNTKDELSAKIKGQVDFKVAAAGGQVRPQLGAYDLIVELDIQASAEKKLDAIWSIIESQIEPFKRASPEGRKSYAFRASGPYFGVSPKLSPAN